MSRTLPGIAIVALSVVCAPAAFAQAPNYQPVRVDLVSYYG